MTQAKMDWKALKLVLRGHAGSAARGKDLICAAESMLTQALIRTLTDMEEEAKLQMRWQGSAQLGTMDIEAVPAEGHAEEARACFRVTVTGLRMLAEAYPEYIKLEEE